MTRIAFMSIAAAETNIGDILIRRAATRIISANGQNAVIYTGAMGRAYVEAFDLPSDWIVTSSWSKFIGRLIIACFNQRAVVVLAPGPANMEITGFALVKRVLVTLLIAMVRISRNHVVVLGRAVRGRGKIATRCEKAILRLSALYLARDSTSVELVGPTAVLAPDLGFADIAIDQLPIRINPYSVRNIIAISLRREPNVSALQRLVSSMQDAGFKVITITQVQSDDQLNARLAGVCGIEHLEWNDTTNHTEQERRVTQAYSGCLAVISDRLHALILGGRYGAIPIIVEREGEDKLHATLDSLLEPQSVWLTQDPTDAGELQFELGIDEFERVRNAFLHAARRLDHPLQTFLSLLGSNR